MLLLDTKVDVKYKDGGVRTERVPKGPYTKEFKKGSGKDGNRGRMHENGV